MFLKRKITVITFFTSVLVYTYRIVTVCFESINYSLGGKFQGAPPLCEIQHMLGEVYVSFSKMGAFCWDCMMGVPYDINLIMQYKPNIVEQSCTGLSLVLHV